MSDALEKKLQSLHQQNQPDVDFANQLEQQLRDTYRESKPRMINSSSRHYLPYWRRLAAVAAMLTMVVGLFATVKPLQTLAQEIIDFFVHSDITDSSELTHEGTPQPIIVGSIDEAEEIAGFDALEWHEEAFHTIFILAAEGYINLVYERENDRGPLVIISKMSHTYPGDPAPVSPDTDIIDTTINDLPAQFVAGWWHTPRGESTQWHTEQRLLKWQDDHFHYSLTVSSYIADSLEDVVDLAESLR